MFFLFSLASFAVAITALLIARSASVRVDDMQRELAEWRRWWAVLQKELASQARGAARADETAPQPAPQEAPLPAEADVSEPLPATEPVREAPIPPYVAPATPSKPWAIDWENLVGIKLFSWIAGIALVLSAVFLFKYSVEHGWLRPTVRATIGLATGVALLVVCELRLARAYRFTANAMDGAGIAILYATLFSMHARWHLWPAAAVFAGMLVVTAVAVLLSTRRDSVFIALLGLLGGFATPALLSSGENRPLALFSYLLLLNGGISWIAFRKRWPLLTALSVALTAFYQWSWVHAFLTSSQMPLAAAIFVVFAAVAASALWSGTADQRNEAFRKTAAAGAVLPLLFAFFTAVVPEYGARYEVLFGFLLLVCCGLAAIGLWRGERWLHALGGLAACVTFLIWLIASYTHESWPWPLVWLAAFVALYLFTPRPAGSVAHVTAGVLFFVFVGLVIREPLHHATLIGAALALFVVVAVVSIRHADWITPAIALTFLSVAITLGERAPLGVVLAAHAIVFACLFVLAALSGREWLALAAVVLALPATMNAPAYTPREQLAMAALFLALFVAHAAIRRTSDSDSLLPHLAASLVSLLLFVFAYGAVEDLGLHHVIGLLPLTLALLFAALLWQRLSLRDGNQARLAVVAATALAWFTAAIPLQLEKEWITVALALEAAALAWLFRRVPHRGLLAWSIGLFAAVFVRLVFNPAVFAYHAATLHHVFNWYFYAYAVCAAAMYVAAVLYPESNVAARRATAAGGTALLFVLLNIEIADWYSKGETLTFNFFSSSLAQDLTYTMFWALFALTVLTTGIALRSRGARVAALGLLFVTILKCFLHDLARLGGLYRVGSLFGLAVSLVAVGLLLQKFVIAKEQRPAA